MPPPIVRDHRFIPASDSAPVLTVPIFRPSPPAAFELLELSFIPLQSWVVFSLHDTRWVGFIVGCNLAYDFDPCKGYSPYELTYTVAHLDYREGPGEGFDYCNHETFIFEDLRDHPGSYPCVPDLSARDLTVLSLDPDFVFGQYSCAPLCMLEASMLCDFAQGIAHSS